MRIRHIEVFHAVYSCGSVTKAARTLNVSQPSVSKVLAHAELQLGFQLFDRIGGRLVPTPEAQRLHGHVSRLFDEIGVVRRVAHNLREMRDGKLRLATTPAMGIDLFPTVVAAFNARHPNVHFELETLHYTEIVAALRESRIDVAFAFDPPNQPGIVEQPITEGKFVFIKPTSLQLDAPQPIDPADIAHLPFIRLNNRGPLGQLLDAHLAETDITFDIVATTETYSIAYALVARGMGVSIVDEITAKADESGLVDILPLKPTLKFRVSALHTADIPISKIADNFVDHTRRVVLDLLQPHSPEL